MQSIACLKYIIYRSWYFQAVTSYFLKKGYSASFLLEFTEKHAAASPSVFFLLLIVPLLVVQPKIIF